ncbi:MAG: SusD/RagB family nutrient-binding outer membrane lipoprotein [Bacteroidales bacterium]|nr:SusD/RagB family nutrient-binding outer membrane lipoprotein [Bacteroidales bacterium]
MKKIFIIILIIPIIGYFTSCEKFLDINEDPNNPKDATIIDLLPSAQLGIAFGVSNMLNRVGEDAVQHLVVGRYDGWAVQGSDVSNAWRFSLYAGGLKDLEVIIEKATASGDFHYVGVSKLLKAYAFSIMVDLWDDIPYSEALREDIEYPHFDDAQTIYTALFSLIDEGIADLDGANEISLAGYDLIYNGNINNWKRMGNTLKLKMYNQIRLVQPTEAKAGIEALVAAENSNPGQVLISSEAHDFNFHFFNSASPENRHPGFQNDYMVKGEAYISNYFYNFMLNNNDPRIPYYFYNQNDAFEGRNYGDPAPIGNDGDTRTVQGLYPIGGKYDDGSMLTVSGSSAAGDGAFRMITNMMRLFIEAEAALTMNAVVSDDAETLFEDALYAAFDEVNSLNAPDIDATDIDTYIQARVQAFIDAATTEEKLQILMEDKWVVTFGNGVEAFNDFRRTGYPDIPLPIETNDVELRRYPYPEDEINTNPNALEQPENNQPVFWDNN